MATLLVTIDVEPNLPKRRQTAPGSLANIPALLEMQRRMPDVRLTLLVTYRVATDDTSLRVLDEIHRDHAGEIGAHLHPEETPPFVSPEGDGPLISRLAVPDRAAKLRVLTQAIDQHFPTPVSYRAGRWQLSPEDLRLLADLGYTVDTSHTPRVSWRLEHGPDFAGAPRTPTRDAATGIWEVPVSIGLNRGESLIGQPWMQTYLQAASLELLSLPAPLKAAWNALRPVRPIWLRPTYSTAHEMIEFAQRELEHSPQAILNMMFHSNELAPGGRPFIRTQDDADQIMQRAVEACRYLTEQCGVRSGVLAEAVPPA